MPAGDESEDKKYTVLFDTSKKEMLNPNQGYKKIVQKLKQRYKVSTPHLLIPAV
jgi:hypothetical protein